MVELEVARVDDEAPGRVDGDARGVRDAVADVEELHAEDAEGKGLARFDGVQLRGGEDAVVAELHLDEAMRQLGRVYGHVELRKDEWHGARVVLVAVGDEDGADLVLVLAQVGDVGDDEVHAGHVLFGEHNPGVDDDDVVAVLKGHHVLADFAEAAQGDDPQYVPRGCATQHRWPVGRSRRQAAGPAASGSVLGFA